MASYSRYVANSLGYFSHLDIKYHINGEGNGNPLSVLLPVLNQSHGRRNLSTSKSKGYSDTAGSWDRWTRCSLSRVCSLQLRESINTLPQQAGSQLNPVIPQRPRGKHSNVTTDLSASRNKTPRVQVFLEQPQPSPFIHRHAIVHTSNATQYSVTESKPDSEHFTDD